MATPAAGTGGMFSGTSDRAFKSQLKKIYTWYTGGFIAFVILLAIAEQMGLPRAWIGYIFLFATVGLYAGIGVMSRTSDAAEYYVAGRRVPALFNGMATGADWMSAASFIGMAGSLYLLGFNGLAFILGWTGGYCLVALFLAPYLRKFGQFTIPDFLGARYGGNIPRFVGVCAAILCSFTYVVAQIYGVGLDHDAADRRAVRNRGLPGAGRHPGVLVPGRHARGHVDAGRAVHHPDRRLHDSRGLAVGEDHRRADPAGRLRQGPGKGHRPRSGADQGSEGNPGPRHLQGPCSRGICQAEGCGQVVCRWQGRGGGCRCQGGSRKRGTGCPGCRQEGGGSLSRGCCRRQGRVDEGRRAGSTCRAAHPPRRGVSRQGRCGARRVEAQLPGTGLLPDDRHGRVAAHPDAVLHDTLGAAGPRIGVLVAVLHLPALFHRPGAGGAGEVRRLHDGGRLGVRQAASMGGVMAAGRSKSAVHRRREQGRHRPAGRNRDRRRHHRSGHSRNCGPALRHIGVGRRRGAGGGAVNGRRTCCSRSPMRCPTTSTTRCSIRMRPPRGG